MDHAIANRLQTRINVIEFQTVHNSCELNFNTKPKKAKALIQLRSLFMERYSIKDLSNELS